MVSATDSANLVRIVRFRVVALAAFLATCSGCARLQEYRQGTSPVFGTETAIRDGGRTKAAAREAYAERIGHPPEESETAIAGREQSSQRLAARDRQTQRARMTRRGGRDRQESGKTEDQDVDNGAAAPQISLLPPVGLRANREKSEAETHGFKPRTTRDPLPLVPTDNDLDSTSAATAPPSEPMLLASNSTKPQTPSRKKANEAARLVAESRRAVNALTSYQVKMSHQERVGGRLRPVDEVVLSVRRDPRAVRLEWPAGPNKGREVLYAADSGKGLMHVKMPDGLVPLPRLSIAPDSPLAMSNSRHPITEAGFDTIIAGMEKDVAQSESPNPVPDDLIIYQGLDQPDGLDKPCHKIVRHTPAGEVWLVYIDPEHHLPCYVQATDARGELLERYIFREPVLNPTELASADAFNPDARWGAPKGLFQRMARGGSETPKESVER